jgi:hypothetical protein
MFSRRLPPDLAPNRLALRRTALPPRYDLTGSDPTRAGIVYPAELLRPLGEPRGLVHEPDPRGHPAARAAVAAEARRRGQSADPDAILLTASTSEAYALLFKLLCDPGEAVLVPVPSYPLFEHLAALEGVRAEPYRLDPDQRFQPALPELPPPGARALVAVHPNNPTGTLLDAASGAALAGWCARHGLALIVDEVFLDYPLDPARAPRSLAGTGEALTFALGGLSKACGLPQLKLAWTIVSGPGPERARALEALAFAADSYLSVGTPVQLALGELLAAARPVREAILARCRAHLALLRAALAPLPGASLIEPDGGWSAVIRYPAVADGEDLALALLEQDRVAVHPGWFFDLPDAGWLVVSLLPEPAEFAEGVARLVRRLARL